MDSPFWENVIAAQFRHVAGSIGSRVPPQCRNRAAWRAAKQWMPPSAACSGLPRGWKAGAFGSENRATLSLSFPS